MIVNPASLKRISIAMHNLPSFFENSKTIMPFLYEIAGNIPVNVPCLDMYDDAAYYELLYTAGFSDNYYMGMIESMNINGIDLYGAVNTFTYSKFLSLPLNNKIMTEGSLSVPVLFPYDGNEFNSYFLEILWRLSVYPFVPFFLNSDMYPQNIGGPLFVKSFKIGSGDGKPTMINIEFTGGSYITPPNPYADNGLSTYLTGYGTTEGWRTVYRGAMNYDSLISMTLNTEIDTSVGINSAYGNLASALVVSGLNIKDINLTVDQEIHKVYTANDKIFKFLGEGVKYISMKSRKVQGSISFVSSSDLTSYFLSGKNKEMVMFFGGPFYYPMKNVSIQVFSSTLAGDGVSFMNEVKFLALLQESNYPQYYKQNEFDIHYEGLYEPISASVYATPQPAFSQTDEQAF